MAKSMPVDELYHELNFARRQVEKRDRDIRVTDDFLYWVGRRDLFRTEIDRRRGRCD